MDVIDATIDSHDMRALDQDVTLEWPVHGMACHVKGCTTSRFKDFSLMQKHWSRIHQPTQTFFCCPLGRHCFEAITRSLVRRHMKQRHPSLEVPEDFDTTTMPTSGNIDRLDAKMPMVTVPLGAVRRRRRRRAAEARQGNSNILGNDFLRGAHPDKKSVATRNLRTAFKRRKRNWRLSDEDTLSVPVSFPSLEEDFELSMELMRGADDDTLDLS